MSQYSSPKIWGPHFWFMLRCIANNYPVNPSQEDIKHVKTFFNELQFLLPCEVCRYTYRQHINKNPIEKSIASKSELVSWVEVIFQETKRVINDKRVKIMDTYEEEEELRPIKKVYKTTKQDLENKTMRSVLHREIIIPAPNASISIQTEKPKSPPKKVMKARTQKTIYQMSSPQSDNFDIVNAGRKIDIEAIKNQRNVVIVNQKQKKELPTNYMSEPLQKPNPIKYNKPVPINENIQTELKTIQLPVPSPLRNNNIPASLNLPIPKNNKSITSQKSKIETVTKPRHVNPKYTAPIINNRNKHVNVYNKELIITKKCKKCET